MQSQDLGKLVVGGLIFFLALWNDAWASDVRIINLQTKDLVYDPFTQKIYASVPSSAGVVGNSITVIDPATAIIGPSVLVGSEPGKLALSDDGQLLYVALNAGVIRRFHIPTQTPGLQFSLGNDSFGRALTVDDMAVQPGHSGVLAVARGGLNTHEGVAIYDNGVQRANVTARHTGSTVIEFSDSPNRLYGYNDESTEFGFRRMHVDEQGVSVLDAALTIILNFNVDIKFDSGFIFSTSGRVIDPETRTAVGSFVFPRFASNSLVLPDVAAERVYFLRDNTLLTYSLATFTPLASEVIPGVIGNPTSLIRWGADGFAFRTSENQVVLLRTTQSVPAADISVTMTGTPNAGAGSTVTHNITVTNNGTIKATNVTLNELLNIGDMPVGSSAAITIIVTPSSPASVLTDIAVNANEPDPETADNVKAITTSGTSNFAGPDLKGSWVAMAQTCTKNRRPTCTLKGVFDVANIGTTFAPQSVLRLVASIDGSLATTDTAFREIVVDSLGPNQTKRVNFSVKLPRGVTTSRSHMIGFVDAIGAIPETDEGNNIVVFGPIP